MIRGLKVGLYLEVAEQIWNLEIWIFKFLKCSNLPVWAEHEFYHSSSQPPAHQRLLLCVHSSLRVLDNDEERPRPPLQGKDSSSSDLDLSLYSRACRVPIILDKCMSLGNIYLQPWSQVLCPLWLPAEPGHTELVCQTFNNSTASVFWEHVYEGWT